MKKLKEESQLIETAKIVPDANQPRKYFDPTKMNHLKNSIKKYGIMSPLTVEKIGEKYLLVDGERRFRAATENKLKEVPCIVIAPQSGDDRLIQQFHLQEQHEGWTATEKASTVYALSINMNISMEQLADMLGIDPRTIARYVSFSNLLDRKTFEKYEISLNWTTNILALRKLAKRLYEEKLEKVFTPTMELNLEKAIVQQIRNGELKRPYELARLKDVFNQSPKEIEEFINKGTSLSELFIKTKARAAYHLRNAATSARYATTHMNRYLESPTLLPSVNDVSAIKGAMEAFKKFLAKVQD